LGPFGALTPFELELESELDPQPAVTARAVTESTAATHRNCLT
jgi:hypothetical protein